MNNIIQDKYIITYSNYFEFENKVFAFRKKFLFDITNIPIYYKLQLVGSAYGYWINRKFCSLKYIESIIIKNKYEKDVTDLEWYMQEDLNDCFNLENYCKNK